MVLIIDDDVRFIANLETFLRSKGIETISVTEGVKALTMLHIRKPRLIILDLNMPNLDGAGTLRAIRNEPMFKDIPILIYSADATEEKMNECMAAGAQDYIVKGAVGWDKVLDRVREFLGA